MATNVQSINAPEPKSNSTSSTEFERTQDEFELMLRYTLSEGLDVDDKTQALIAQVQQGLDRGQPPVGFDTLMQAHLALSKIIAPATPLSLEATEPAPGWLGSLKRPPLVYAMIIIAAISVFGFVVTNIWVARSDNRSTAVGLAATNPGVARSYDEIPEKLNWMFAAALGAVVYVLFTAHGYVKDRTFDPRYNSLYVIRFVLGVLSGLILAIVLQKWFPGSSTGTASAGTGNANSGPDIRILGPAVIALLGGFSTEAVYQILQRMVEILLAAVRGDDSDSAKAKASQQASSELLTLADDSDMPAALKSKAIAAAKKLTA